ncbi:unnamed protein product [Symbiodinium sp. KB8]|nr:unnamed protein product [Symbiodinium sp. KB8]
MPAFLLVLVFGCLPLWTHCDVCEEDDLKVVFLQTQVRIASSTPALKPLGHSFYSTDPARSAAWWLRYSTSQPLPAASQSLLNLVGVAEAEEASAVQVRDSEGPAGQLYFLKVPSWRSPENLTMADFVKAAEMSWSTVMTRRQLYSPWTDFHVGHKMKTMKPRQFQEDDVPYQYYIPDPDFSRGWRIIRAYVPNTTWTVEWLAQFYDSEKEELNEAWQTQDPDHCRGQDDRDKRDTWWKSTFGVANASLAQDFAIKVLVAVPAGQPFPWPPRPDCLAAQWVTLPYDGEEWKALQMHFVENPVYSCTLHDLPELLRHQREFVQSHPDCINSFMLNSLVLETRSLDPFIRRLAETSTPHFVFKVSDVYALIFSFPGNEMEIQHFATSASQSRLNLVGLAESEEASAVQLRDSEGPIEQLHFFKAPNSRSTEGLAMEDFVKAAELSWDSVMQWQQLYSPWTDFHVGLKVDTMRADHLQEDNYSFQYYVPKLANESWNCKVIRAYIPNTTWTVEWHADLLSPKLLDQEFLESRRTEDPDHCRGFEGPEMRETWWKSTFAVANASAARDFAIKVLAAVPRGEPYPWPPQQDCIAAQWVTLPDDGAGERTPMQLHFVEDGIYSSILHGLPELLQYQRDFVRSHQDCINSFMLNNLVLETASLDPFIRRLAETLTPHFVFQVSDAFALIFSFPGNEMVTLQIRSRHSSLVSPTPVKFCT